jgi:hypothetical protein
MPPPYSAELIRARSPLAKLPKSEKYGCLLDTGVITTCPDADVSVCYPLVPLFRYWRFLNK